MSFIGDLFTSRPEAKQNTFQAVAYDPQDQAQLRQQQQANLGNINADAAALQAQAAGQGPSVANAVLKNAQDVNAANAASIAAGQRGINPGMALRQALQSNAASNQQAAAQGVVGRQQEQLLGQQLLQQNRAQAGGAASNMMNQSLQAGQANQAANLQAALANQGAANAMNQANAEQSNAATGGVLGGLAATFGLGGKKAHGGEIKGYADGGAVDFNSASKDSGGGIGAMDLMKVAMLAQGGQAPGFGSNWLQNAFAAPAPMAPATDFESAMAQGHGVSPASQAAEAAMAAGHGAAPMAAPGPSSMTGKFLSGLSDRGLDAARGVAKIGSGIAQEAGNIGADLGFARGGGVNMKSGGHVPGEAKVKGDSYSNDTVPALLSPKEIVLPRSVTMSKDPAHEAAKFVAAIKAKKSRKLK